MDRESLDTYLGGLESEELIELNTLLTELQTHPGWPRYVELVEIQREKANYQLTARPMRDVQSYAHAGGYIRGLEHSGRFIIEKVSRTTRAVIEALEKQREDGT